MVPQPSLIPRVHVGRCGVAFLPRVPMQPAAQPLLTSPATRPLGARGEHLCSAAFSWVRTEMAWCHCWCPWPWLSCLAWAAALGQQHEVKVSAHVQSRALAVTIGVTSFPPPLLPQTARPCAKAARSPIISVLLVATVGRRDVEVPVHR